MDSAKDTCKQEKQKSIGIASGGDIGGVAVVLATAALAAASVVAIRLWKSRNSKTSGSSNDELDKGNAEADMPSSENDSKPLEIIGKMREDKTNPENDRLNEDEEKSAQDTIADDHTTQNNHLSEYQIKPQEIEVEKEDDAVMVVPKILCDEDGYAQEEDEELNQLEERCGEDSINVEEEEEPIMVPKSSIVEVENKEEKVIMVPKTPHFEVEYKEERDEAIAMVLKSPHVEAEYKEEEDEATMMVTKTPHFEVKYKVEEASEKPVAEVEFKGGFESKKGHDIREDVVIKNEELSGEELEDLVKCQVNPQELEVEEEDEPIMVPKSSIVEVENKEEKPIMVPIMPHYEFEYEAEEDETIMVVPDKPHLEVEYKEEKAIMVPKTPHFEVAYKAEEDETIMMVPETPLLEVEYEEKRAIMVPRAPHFEVETKAEEDETIMVVLKSPHAEAEYKEEDDETTMMVPKTPNFEIEYKEEEASMVIHEKPAAEVEFESIKGHEIGEDDVKKNEELAEEIEVETSMTLGHENEDSDENNSIEGQLEERVSEISPQLIQFATEGQLQVTEEDSVLKERIDDYLKVETEEKSLKNESGESVFNSIKRRIKEILLDQSSTRIWLWAIVVFVLAIAAPMVFYDDGFVKLFPVVVFVIGFSGVLQTIM